jgi:hypothetical protein
VYVVKHFGTHTVRGVWESAAGDAAKQRLLTSLNLGNASWVLITDHKAKKNPSKFDTEQGIFLSLPHVASLILSLPLFLPHLIPSNLHPILFDIADAAPSIPVPVSIPGYDMGLRGMSTHGFQLTFAVEYEGEKHLVTVQYNVFYSQTSEQLLPEAMSAVHLVLNQMGRDFPWLRTGTIVSDKCNTLQAFEQILFVVAGNREGWTTASHNAPCKIRVGTWTHSEAGCGKDTLDSHFAWLEVGWNNYLRCDGDIVCPRDMFEAASTYPVANTSYILADTSHPGFKTKFNVPRLGVRSVHVHVYGEDGNVELYHHTGIKKPGMHEKIWFTPPPDIPPGATQAATTEHRLAIKSHSKVAAWFAINNTETHHATIEKGGEFIALYYVSSTPPKMEAKTFYKTKEVASPFPFIAMVASTALDFANVAHASANERRGDVMVREGPLLAVVQVDVTGYNSAQKKAPANVRIKGPIRATLKEIFKRVPHVSATNAHKEVVSEYEFNMWVRYNVSEERCKRLFGSWTTRSSDNKPKVKLAGWKQWRAARLRVFVTHFHPNASVRNKNIPDSIKLLPPFEEKHNTEMLKIGVGTAGEASGDLEPDDDADDGEVVEGESHEDAVDHGDHEAADCGEEGTNLGRVIASMAPPQIKEPRAPAAKRKSKCEQPKKGKCKQLKKGEAELDVYIVEEIRSGSNNKNPAQCEVKWEGHGTDENTWEPKDALPLGSIKEYLLGRLEREREEDAIGLPTRALCAL